MTDGPVVTLPAAILEGDDLLVLALLHDLARDRCALDERRSVRDLVAIAMEQDVGEDTLFAGFLIEEIHVDDVALRDAMLSAACLNNCVSHTKSWVNASGEKPRKVPQLRSFDKRNVEVLVPSTCRKLGRLAQAPVAS